MTTREPDYSIAQRLALMIEDEAENDTDGKDPKQLTKDYIENTLDNGYISEGNDTPVWELIEALGYDRTNMDEFKVFAEIVELIDDVDLFNG